jgi:hypothetical protein
MPYGVAAVLKVSSVREYRGDVAGAYAAVQKALTYSGVSEMGGQGELALLKQALPLSLKLGKCIEARDIAQRILAFEPADAPAAAALDALRSDPVSGASIGRSCTG